MSTSKPTVIGYVRVSTDQQVDGASLDAQRSRIASWCEANDCDLGAIHTDAGLSGKRSDNRPELQAALTEVCRSKGILVVYSLSRLARSTRDTLDIAERLDKAGADLVSLTERIDSTGAAGKMVFRMLAVLAEFERDLASERTTEALRSLRSQGRRISRHAPYGYRLNGRGWIEDEREQEAVQVMRTLRADGLSLRQIAAELDQQGHHNRRGGRLSAKTIAAVLRRA